MSKQKLKYFNQPDFNEAIRIANLELPIAKRLSDALHKFKCESLEEAEEYLTQKTGFVNHRMSASAMGLEDEYNSIVESYGTIDFRNYKKDFSTITQSYEDEIKELYCTYWSKEDASFIEKANKLVVQLNELGIARYCMYSNQANELKFNTSGWDVERQMRRIANR